MLARFRAAATKRLRGSTSNHALLREKVDSGEQPDSPLGGGLLFGVPLEIVSDLGPPLMSTEHAGVPAFFETAFAYLEEHERRTEGLFRLSGSAATIKAYKRQLDLGESLVWEPTKDAHNATGLIKMYLRELPEPLLTFNFFDPFCQAVACTDETLKRRLMKTLLAGLPHLQGSLLGFLVARLTRFLAFEGDTKMGVSNLATLFGPNIARPEHEISDQHQMLLCTSKAAAIVSYLLSHPDVVLGSEADGEGEGEADAEGKGAAEAEGATTSRCRAVIRVIYEYDATEEDELSLIVGNIIFVEEMCEDSWWAGVMVDETTGLPRRGRFPSNYTEVLYRNEIMVPQRDREVSPAGGEPSPPLFQLDKVELFDPLATADPATTETGSRSETGAERKKEENHVADATEDDAGPAAGPFEDPEPAQESSEAASVHSAASSASNSWEDRSMAMQPNVKLLDRIAELERELGTIRADLQEERRQRESLAAVIPELMKNQDEVIKLLQSLSSTQ